MLSDGNQKYSHPRSLGSEYEKQQRIDMRSKSLSPMLDPLYRTLRLPCPTSGVVIAVCRVRGSLQDQFCGTCDISFRHLASLIFRNRSAKSLLPHSLDCCDQISASVLIFLVASCLNPRLLSPLDGSEWRKGVGRPRVATLNRRTILCCPGSKSTNCRSTGVALGGNRSRGIRRSAQIQRRECFFLVPS